MGSKKELTYIVNLRYYTAILSIVPQLRYNYKLCCSITELCRTKITAARKIIMSQFLRIWE